MDSGKGPEDSGGGRGLPCQVETYSGQRLHERPQRFTWLGAWLEVRRVLRAWREPEHLCFIVTANDSQRYLLKYFPRRDVWEVQLSG